MFDDNQANPRENGQLHHPLASVGPMEAGLGCYFASNWVETVEEGVALLSSAPEQFPGRAAFMAAAAKLLGAENFALCSARGEPRAMGCRLPDQVPEPLPETVHGEGGAGHE